jgi:hypothetical protein
LVEGHRQQDGCRGATRGGQCAGREQAGGGVGQRIVHPLAGAAQVFSVGLGRTRRGERVEHGLPLREGSRSQVGMQFAGAIAIAGQRGGAAPLVVGVVGQRAVRVEDVDYVARKPGKHRRIEAMRLGDQPCLDVGAVLELYSRRQLVDRPDDHPGVLVRDRAGGLRCGDFRKQGPETFAADRSARAEIDCRANPAFGFVG